MHESRFRRAWRRAMTISDDEQLRETLRPVAATIDLDHGRKVITTRLRRALAFRAVGGITVLALIVGLLVAAPWNDHPSGDNRVSVGTKRSPSAPTVDD